MRRLAIGSVVLVFGACYEGTRGGAEPGGAEADTAGGTEAGDGADGSGSDDVESGGADESGTDGVPGGEEPPRPIVYRTVGELFTEAMAPTCSPNVGVCHNSDAYPDLHTVANLVSLVGEPCNSSAESPAEVHDFCEPPGDRLVFPTHGIDVEIARVIPTAEGDAWGELSAVDIVLMDAMPTLPPVDESAVEIHRDGIVIALGDGGAFVGAADSDSVTLSLDSATDSVRRFLDDRMYPWDDTLVRVADPNGNGIAGFSPDNAMVVPGDPARSYLVLRLFDSEYGDVMPRQCRTWNDEATRALGCFIASLDPAADGLAIADDDPIDYEGCDFDPVGLGICGTGNSVGDILARSCGGAACHIDEDEPAAGLDLSAGVALTSLVDAPSSQDPTRALVVPGDPDGSYLMCKLRASCDDRVGTRMPPVGAPALTSEEIAVIEAWIEDGAPIE